MPLWSRSCHRSDGSRIVSSVVHTRRHGEQPPQTDSHDHGTCPRRMHLLDASEYGAIGGHEVQCHREQLAGQVSHRHQGAGHRASTCATRVPAPLAVLASGGDDGPCQRPPGRAGGTRHQKGGPPRAREGRLVVSCHMRPNVSGRGVATVRTALGPPDTSKARHLAQPQADGISPGPRRSSR